MNGYRVAMIAFCTIMWMPAFLRLTGGPASTQAQATFRILCFTTGLAGVIVVWALKKAKGR